MEWDPAASRPTRLNRLSQFDTIAFDPPGDGVARRLERLPIAASDDEIIRMAGQDPARQRRFRQGKAPGSKGGMRRGVK